MLLLCFYFKNLDLFDRQITQLDFSLSTLFVAFTSCGLKLCVNSLHPKQFVVPGLFPVFYWFYFWLCAFHVLRYQFFIVIFPKLLVIWLVFNSFSFLILYFCFFIFLFELLVFLVFLLVLLFQLHFLFLIFLYLIEQCNPAFY